MYFKTPCTVDRALLIWIIKNHIEKWIYQNIYAIQKFGAIKNKPLYIGDDKWVKKEVSKTKALTSCKHVASNLEYRRTCHFPPDFNTLLIFMIFNEYALYSKFSVEISGQGGMGFKS